MKKYYIFEIVLFKRVCQEKCASNLTITKIGYSSVSVK